MGTLKRRIYSSQSLEIQGIGYIPIKSVSVSREIPIEPLMILGVLDGALQQQKGPETFKIDVKAYFTNDLTHAKIKALFDKTEKGIPTEIKMENYGDSAITNAFKANVVLTNISFDTTVGDFIDVGFTFQGLGDPNIIVNSSVNLEVKDVSIISPGNVPIPAVEVKDSSNIIFKTPNLYGETIKSLKFSFEMPVEILYSYATDFNTSKVNLVGKSLDNDPNKTVMNLAKLTYVAKAPYKATLNIEGQHIKQYRDGEAGQTPTLINGVQRGGKLDKINVGGSVDLTLVNAALKTFTSDQSPGEVGANFSASYEGTHVGEFSSIATYLTS